MSISNSISEDIDNQILETEKENKEKIQNPKNSSRLQSNNRICVEGRDIASKILSKNPKYDLAFYFKCELDVASYRRWLDLDKKIPLFKVKESLKKRTQMDKKRKNSPLVKVKNAILIRTDLLSKKQVLTKMSKHIEKII